MRSGLSLFSPSSGRIPPTSRLAASPRASDSNALRKRLEGSAVLLSP